MSNNPHNLKVGQKLWFVNREGHSGKNRWVTVKKVGRIWADLDGGWSNLRIDLSTLVADGRGYASSGRCYITREEHEEWLANLLAWEALRRDITHSYLVPDGVTAESIAQARRLLGLEKSS